MRLNGEMGIAFAVGAAVVGAGFASGREIVTFFSCTGWASWLGIVLACAAMGALSAMLAEFARRTGARSFPGVYSKVMGSACGDSVQVLHGITMLLTASVMLTAAGELGALALPVQHAYPISMFATLLVAVFMLWREFRPLRYLGALLAPAVCMYYLLLALDPTPASVRMLNSVDTVELSGSVAAACFLGLLYAALNAAMSGGVLTSLTDAKVRPVKLGIKVGALLLCMLVPANAALLRAGEPVRRLALPGVVLAARWGTVGFYASVFIMWLSVLSTLVAALGSLCAQAKEIRLDPRFAVCLASLAAACLSVIGFRALIQVGYPLLGWVCALVLLALLPFLREDDPNR